MLLSPSADTLRAVQADVNSAHDIGREFAVRAMPTFHFYLNGGLVQQFQGADQRTLQSTAADLARLGAVAADLLARLAELRALGRRGRGRGRRRSRCAHGLTGGETARS